MCPPLLPLGSRPPGRRKKPEGGSGADWSPPTAQWWPRARAVLSSRGRGAPLTNCPSVTVMGPASTQPVPVKGVPSTGPSVRRAGWPHRDWVLCSFLREAAAGGWEQARGTPGSPWLGRGWSNTLLLPTSQHFPKAKVCPLPLAHLEPSAWAWDTEPGHSQGGLPGGGGPALLMGSPWPEGVGDG